MVGDLQQFTCAEVFHKLDLYLDRELSPDEIAQIQEHLERCAACAAEERFEASFLNEVRAKVRRIALPTDLMDRVLRALQAGRAEPRS